MNISVYLFCFVKRLSSVKVMLYQKRLPSEEVLLHDISAHHIASKLLQAIVGQRSVELGGWVCLKHHESIILRDGETSLILPYSCVLPEYDEMNFPDVTWLDLSQAETLDVTDFTILKNLLLRGVI